MFSWNGAAMAAAALVLAAAPVQAQSYAVRGVTGIGGFYELCDTDCRMGRGLMEQGRRAEQVVDQDLGSGTKLAYCGQLSMALSAYTMAASHGIEGAREEAKRVSSRIGRQCPYGWPR